MPVVDAKQRLLGTLKFWFLIVGPLKPSESSSAPEYLRRVNGKSSIIGHYGNGQNALIRDRPRIQIGENTMQSFMSAYSLGVTMVEFDVQMTADLIPLVYHDYLVSETGTDAPVHIITLDQFKHIGRSQQTQGAQASMAESRHASKSQAGKGQRARANTMDVYEEWRIAGITDRVKGTYQFKEIGFQG